MSLAPASSRGAFLNARLAVNGIQCAARSFGTLTADLGGLLSSIGILNGGAGASSPCHAISFGGVRKPTDGCRQLFGKGEAAIPVRADRGGRLAALRVRWYHPAHGRKTQKAPETEGKAAARPRGPRSG